jgi:hypothetical protein
MASTTSWLLIQRSTVWCVCVCVCLCVWSRNLNREAAYARVGLLHHRKESTSQFVAAKLAWYNNIIRVLSIMPSTQIKLYPYTVTTICRVLKPFWLFFLYSVNKCPTRCDFLQFLFPATCSTCFGWHLHPSSGERVNCNYSIRHWSNLKRKRQNKNCSLRSALLRA